MSQANKVILNGEVLIDLTNDTADEADVAAGKIFHKADGTIATGTALAAAIDKSEQFFAENFPSDTWAEGEYTTTIQGVSATMRYKYRKDREDPKNVPFTGTLFVSKYSGDVEYEQVYNLADWYLKSASTTSSKIAATGSPTGSPEYTFNSTLFENPVVPIYLDMSNIYAESLSIPGLQFEYFASQAGVKTYEGTMPAVNVETVVSYFLTTNIRNFEPSILEAQYLYIFPTSLEWHHEVNYAYGGSNIRDYLKSNFEITANGRYYFAPYNGYYGADDFSVNVPSTGDIIEVDTLPTENIDENAVYFCDGKYCKYGSQFQDVVVNIGFNVLPYVELLKVEGATVSTNIIPTKTTDGILTSDPDNGIFHFYYIADETESNAFVYSEGTWVSFGEMMGGAPYGGVISDLSGATTAGTYYVLGSVGWVEYVHPTGTLNIVANGTYDVADKKDVVVNIPSAIIVQTVDDLPEDAQMGSMALVLGV